MTEAEWLACDTPTLLLAHVRGKLSHREDRLLAVALCRRIEDLVLDQRSRLAIDVAEAFAAGEVSAEALRTASNAAVDAQIAGAGSDLGAEGGGWDDTHIHAADAVTYCAELDSLNPAMLTVQRVLSALAHRGTIGNVTPLLVRLVHEIAGNPFLPTTLSPEWRTSTVVALARGMYESRDFSPMPILADAFEDAGCDNDDILTHCRGDGPHVRGCWVVDLVLGKE